MPIAVVNGAAAARSRLATCVRLGFGALLVFMVVAPAHRALANGAPGSYAIVFDQGGEPLAGTYWIAPNVRVVMRGRGQPAGVRPLLMDREFLPERFSDFSLLEVARFGHIPALKIEDLKLGTAVTVLRQRFTPRFDAILAMAAKPEPAAVPETRGADLTMRITLVGSQMLTLGDRSFATYSIESRDEGPLKQGEDGISRQLYIAGPGMLIMQDKAGLATRIEQGQAVSSADFVTYFEMLAYRTVSPSPSACLAAKRETEAFKKAATAYRDFVDAYTAKSFPLSSLSYEMAKGTKDIEPLIKDAMNFLICPP